MKLSNFHRIDVFASSFSRYEENYIRYIGVHDRSYSDQSLVVVIQESVIYSDQPLYIFSPQERSVNRNIKRMSSIGETNEETDGSGDWGAVSEENKVLKEENEKMKEEIDSLMISLDEDMKKDPECQDRQFTQLMNQVRELKEENIQLRNRLNEKDTQDKENTV